MNELGATLRHLGTALEEQYVGHRTTDAGCLITITEQQLAPLERQLLQAVERGAALRAGDRPIRAPRSLIF